MAHSDSDPQVLMFGWELPPHNSGGLGTACHGLTKALATMGTPITFVLPRPLEVDAPFMKLRFADNPLAREAETFAIDTLIAAYDTQHSYNEKYHHTAQRMAQKQGRSYGRTLIDEVERYAQEASTLSREVPLDVVHSHDWLTFPAGIAAQKERDKPFVAHVHATEYDRTGGQGENRDVAEIEREGLINADHVVTVSNYTKQKITERYRVPEGNITVVHNGIEVSEWQHEAFTETLERLQKLGKYIVLFVGRITIQKGPEYFIQAASKVLEHEPDAVFIVSGSGDMRHQMIEEAARLGIGDRVFFPGFLRGNALATAYRAADLYVMPSVSEPFGITALEAIANEAPVLVSKQSGVAEVLPNALKADFWDVDEIAHKITGVLWNRTLKQTLLSESTADLTRLSWREAAQKCRLLYQRICNLV